MEAGRTFRNGMAQPNAIHRDRKQDNRIAYGVIDKAVVRLLGATI